MSEIGYRRGLLLGFTISELMLLLVFCLLLIFAGYLGHTVTLEREIAKVRAASGVEDIHQIIEITSLGAKFHQAEPTIASNNFDDNFNELTLDRQAVDEMTNAGLTSAQVRQLSTAVVNKAKKIAGGKDPSTEAMAAAVQDTASQIAKQQSAALSGMSDAQIKAVDAAIQGAKDALGTTSTDKAVSALETASKILHDPNIKNVADLSSKLEQNAANDAKIAGIEQQLAAAQAQIAEKDAKNAQLNASKDQQLAEKQRQLDKLNPKGGKGPGGVFPSCWLDDNARPEYIFDVALTERGINVRATDIPHRATDRAALPLSQIKYGMQPAADFSSATTELFKKSVGEECRFYIKLYDQTTSKEMFKTQLLKAEEHFYKLITSERFNVN